MRWITEFTAVTDTGKRVEYQTLDALGYSEAERPDRVRVSGRIVHRGWVSDHKGYDRYKVEASS